MATIVDAEPAIELSVDLDARARVAATVGAGMQLEELAVELQGVVVSDRALILEAADAIEMRGGRLPRGLRMRGGPRKTRIVAGEKAVDDALGVGDSAGMREPQFAHQPILEGTEEALDPPFIRYEIVRYPSLSAEVTVCRGGMVRPSG